MPADAFAPARISRPMPLTAPLSSAGKPAIIAGAVPERRGRLHRQYPVDKFDPTQQLVVLPD
jgi:hypothetical protein